MSDATKIGMGGDTAAILDSAPAQAPRRYSQKRLVLRKFMRHRLAVAGAVITLFIYLVCIFAEVLAPAPIDRMRANFTYAPPQSINLFLATEDGVRFQPHVYGYKVVLNRELMRREFAVDDTKIIPLGFFVDGEPT